MIKNSSKPSDGHSESSSSRPMTLRQQLDLKLDEIEQAFEEGRTADACNMIEALVVEARLDEVQKFTDWAATDRDGYWARYSEKRIAELIQKPVHK